MDNDSDLAAAWQRVIQELQPNQQAWVNASEPTGWHGNTAIIAVGDDFTRTQLEGRLRGQLEDALTETFGREIRLAVTVNPGLITPVTRPQESTSPSVDMSTDLLVAPPSPPVHEPSRAGSGETRLNPKYVFESFVIGSSNRFPHAAAVAVAEAPGKAYNPLLVYGDSGLGKTHLLHAIGHYVRSLYNGARVRYVSSEEFTNEFINAIRDDRQDRFKRRYRDVDVLLIDDIQFLEGKTQTQEEFFHAPDKIPYAIDRYVKETARLYGVLDKRLADREFIAGEYSIADMAAYPWIVPYENQGQKLEDFPHLQRWFGKIKARPATVRAYEQGPKVNPSIGQPMSEDEKKILFGGKPQA